MFELEHEIAKWRDGMQHAGIAGDLRDELESHLRDAFQDRLDHGVPAEAAFAQAAERLGTGASVRREYEAALTRTQRLRLQLREPVGLFPTQLTFCAWGAVPFGLQFAVAGILLAYEHRLSVRLWDAMRGGGLDRETAITFLSVLAPILGAWYVLSAARDYLKRPDFSSARRLAVFWVFNLLAHLLALAEFLRVHVYGSPAILLWVWVASLIVALWILSRWKRQLRATHFIT